MHKIYKFSIEFKTRVDKTFDKKKSNPFPCVSKPLFIF